LLKTEGGYRHSSQAIKNKKGCGKKLSEPLDTRRQGTERKRSNGAENQNRVVKRNKQHTGKNEKKRGKKLEKMRSRRE